MILNSIDNSRLVTCRQRHLIYQLRIYVLGTQNEGEALLASAGGVEDEENPALCMSYYNLRVRLCGGCTSGDIEYSVVGSS